LRSLVCLFHSARPFLAVAAVVDLAAACPQIAFAHACVSLMAVVKWLHGSLEFQPRVSTESFNRKFQPKMLNRSCRPSTDAAAGQYIDRLHSRLFMQPCMQLAACSLPCAGMQTAAWLQGRVCFLKMIEHEQGMSGI
jgi:hypothetical protein